MSIFFLEGIFGSSSSDEVSYSLIPNFSSELLILVSLPNLSVIGTIDPSVSLPELSVNHICFLLYCFGLVDLISLGMKICFVSLAPYWSRDGVTLGYIRGSSTQILFSLSLDLDLGKEGNLYHQ